VRFATIDHDGKATAPQAVPGQGLTLRARDVSVARRGEELVLLVRDDSPAGMDRVLLARRAGSTWTGLAPLVAEGRPLRSTVTPGIAAGPDGRIYVVTGDLDPPPGTGPAGRLHLYSAAALPGELRDEELEGLRFEDGRPGIEHVPWSRPALVFVPHLDGAGELLSDGRGALALWWTRGTRTRFLTTWGQLDEQGARFSLGRWHHYEAYGYTDAIAGSSPALLRRAGGALTAAIAQSSFEPGKVRHIPFADGVAAERLVLRDFDDRPRIRDSLCRGLNWDCPERCARLAERCVVSTAATPDVRCPLPRGSLRGAGGDEGEQP
jgi:hypothetical protein